MNNLEKYNADLQRLQEDGEHLMLGLLNELKDEVPEIWKKISQERKNEIEKYTFTDKYNAWYNGSLAVLRQLMPERVEDFVEYYKNDKRKELKASTYTVRDFLIGTMLYDGHKSIWTRSDVLQKYQQQKLIIESLSSRFESSLYDIQTFVQADLFDSEIDKAKELCKNGFNRAAGAIAGVVLEKHLSDICRKHNVKIKKKGHPGISDYNETLKAANVIDQPRWRQIQFLGDIRNLCDHNKGTEPTKEDTLKLINGVDEIIKNIV